MDYIGQSILYTFLYYYIFWLGFILVTAIYRAHLAKELRWYHYVLFFIPFIVGLCVDFVGNIVISVPFMDIPHEFLVTDRLKRYQTHPGGIRKRVAEFICQDFLNIFDPRGKHC